MTKELYCFYALFENFSDDFLMNSKPPVNWWFAHTLKGFSCRHTRQRVSKFGNASLSRAAAMSRLSFLPYLFLIPVNGSMYSLILIWSCVRSSSSCFLIYSWITLSLRPTVVTYLYGHYPQKGSNGTK